MYKIYSKEKTMYNMYCYISSDFLKGNHSPNLLVLCYHSFVIQLPQLPVVCWFSGTSTAIFFVIFFGWKFPCSIGICNGSFFAVQNTLDGPFQPTSSYGNSEFGHLTLHCSVKNNENSLSFFSGSRQFHTGAIR